MAKKTGKNLSILYKRKKTIGIPKTRYKLHGYSSIFIAGAFILIFNGIGLLLFMDLMLLIFPFSIVTGAGIAIAMSKIDKKSGLPTFMLKYHNYRNYDKQVIVNGIAYTVNEQRQYENVDESILI